MKYSEQDKARMRVMIRKLHPRYMWVNGWGCTQYEIDRTDERLDEYMAKGLTPEELEGRVK